MSFDIHKFNVPKHLTNRYSNRLSRLKKQGKDTTCIESAVHEASHQIQQNSTRSFVIYGEPQSGKTEMMIALTAKLLDMGHKIIVHLLNDNVSLLDQNLFRFQNSGLSPSPCNFTEILDPVVKIGDKEWVLFCKKNAKNLSAVLEKIGHIDGKIVIDDEADFASPNSKVNSGEKTRINELIEKLLRKKGIYIGVTATPARLDLNNTFENDHERWVDFPAHQAYNGQDTFFPLGAIDQFRITFITDGAGDQPKWPRGALLGFLVNVAHLNLHNTPANYSFLMHTSGKKADHKRDYQQVQKIFGTLSNPSDSQFEKCVEAMWKIADARYPGEADQVVSYTLDNIGSRNIIVMNSAKEFEKNHKGATTPSTTFTVVIGGNIVSRGMTFDNLLSMYFTRDVKHKIQQDTYIQRARMFGARTYLDHFELTIPETLYEDWHRCFIFHRLALDSIRSGKAAPVWLESKRIATTASSSIDRSNVAIDAGEMSYAIFDFNSLKEEISKIVGSEQPNLSKLKSLQSLLGEESFPSFVISYIEHFSPNGNESILVHPTHSIADMHDADQNNISRRRGFMGGALFTKEGPVVHHVRVSFNAKGKARLFYKYSGGIRVLKNLK